MDPHNECSFCCRRFKLPENWLRHRLHHHLSNLKRLEIYEEGVQSALEFPNTPDHVVLTTFLVNHMEIPRNHLIDARNAFMEGRMNQICKKYE